MVDKPTVRVLPKAGEKWRHKQSGVVYTIGQFISESVGGVDIIPPIGPKFNIPIDKLLDLYEPDTIPRITPDWTFIGATVLLKCGGMKMVVEGPAFKEKSGIEVVPLLWHDDNGVLQSAAIPVACLMPFDGDGTMGIRG